MKVSVLIVNWNGAEVLPSCLAALRRQTRPPDQIVIVDNGSRDESVQWLEQQSHIDVVRLDNNRGFAGGNNAALPILNGDIVALLNNDAEPEPQWIADALPAFEDEMVGMVACKIMRLEEPQVIDKVGHLIYPDGLNRGRGTGQRDEGQFDTTQAALWPDGCAAFFRLAAIAEVGFFDEDFFLYGEDADLGFRMRWAGYDCRFVPSSRVLHRQSASLGRFSADKVYFIERNRWWVLIKNFPISGVLLSPLHSLRRYLLNAWSMLRGKGSAASFQRQASAWALLKVLIKATWHGLRYTPRMWRKRRQRVMRITARQMKRLLRQYRISAREITLAD